MTIKAIIPSEQSTRQAKAQLEREDINPKKVEDMFQSTTRRGKKRKSKGVSHRGKSRKVVKQNQRGGKKSARRKKETLSRKRIYKKTNNKRDIFETK